MKVNRKELRDILSILSPGLAKREFVPQSTHFIFFENEVATFNDKILLTHPYTSETPFSVKGIEFFRLIDGITDEDIEITVVKGKVKVKSKGTSASMSTISEENNVLPESIELVEHSRKDWKPLPKDFLEGISLCSFSVSPDLTKGVLACVGVIGEYCYALDHARASVFQMDAALSEDLFIIGKEAMELAKFPVIEYCIGGNWGHFRTEDDVTFSCKLMKGSFPLAQVESTLEKMIDLPTIVLPAELKATVDNIVVLASDLIDKSGRLIMMDIRDGEVFVKASNELGHVEKTLPCKYDGPSISLRINSKFLSQILEKTTELSVQGHMLLFSSGSFSHLLAQTGSPKKEE